MICSNAELEIDPKHTANSLKLYLNSQHKEGQQCPIQQILSTHDLRQKLTVIGVLLFTEPELLSTNPVSSQQKHDHHLLQQKQAFAFELSANKKMPSVLLAQPMDAGKRKTRQDNIEGQCVKEYSFVLSKPEVIN